MRAARSLSLMALLVVTTACGQVSAPTDAPAPSRTVEPRSAPTPASPVGLAACDDLELLLPDVIGEASLTTFCLSGADFVDAGDPTAIALLEQAGADPGAAALAWAQGSDGVTTMFIYQVGDGDIGALRDAFAAEFGGGVGFEEATVGGKSVLVAETGRSGATTYLYAMGHTLVTLTTPDAEVAGSVLSELP